MKKTIIISMMLFTGFLHADSGFDSIVVGFQYGEIPVYLDPETVIESYKDFATKNAEKTCRSAAARISEYVVSILDEVEAAVPTLVSAHYVCENAW